MKATQIHMFISASVRINEVLTMVVVVGERDGIDVLLGVTRVGDK